MLRSEDSRSVSALEASDAAELGIARRAQLGDRHAFDLLVINY
jgi:hypothetical protein